MPALTATEKQNKLEELVGKLNEFIMGDGDESLKTLRETLKDLGVEFDKVKGIDVKSITDELEKLRAGHEKMVEQIRTQKTGFYIPGVEDMGKKFSFCRLMKGIHSGNWKGCEVEKEIVDHARTKAGQVVGDDSVGGFFVPDQVIPDVIGAIYTKSVFINLTGEDGDQTRVTVLDGLTGGNIKIPKFNGGTIAYWIGEEDEYVESRTTVGDITMNPKKLGILVKMSDSMLRFQGFGFEQLLRRDMVRAAAKKLDYTIAYGDGTDNTPRGIMNTPGINVFDAETGVVAKNNVVALTAAQDDWQNAELTFDGIDDMLLILEEDDVDLDESAVMITSPRYRKRLKRIKVDSYATQTTNQSYLLGMPIIPDARLRDAIGDFATSTQINNAQFPGASVGAPTTESTDAFSGDVIHGNLSEVILGRWAGVEIEDDAGKGKGFTSDHLYMKVRIHADINIRQVREIIVCPNAQVRDA